MPPTPPPEAAGSGETGAPARDGALLAACCFLVYALVTARAADLLDAAELADAAFTLGVAHPPGEPLAALWGKLFSFVPLGSVAFRVGLGQAAAGALAVFALHRLVALILPRLAPNLAPTAVRLVAAAGVSLFAFAPGTVLSADRPEVYALQAALSLGALALAVAGTLRDDPRLALIGGFLVGLGIGNHPLIAGLTGAGAAWAAWPLLRRHGVRMLLAAVGSFAAGLLVLLYIPLRAAALPPLALSWGDAQSLSRLWWVLSARTFAEKAEVVHGQAHAEDAPFVLMEEVGVVTVLVALAGLPAAARRLGRHSRTRAPLVGIGLALVGAAVAGMIGGLDATNPDIRGYLLVASALTALLAACAVAVALGEISRRGVALAVAAVLAIATTARAPFGVAASSRRDASGAEMLARQMLGELPRGAVLLTSHFQTAFLVGYLRHVEGLRPDVAWVHLGFVGGPGYVERAVTRYPELAPVLRAFERGNGAAASLAALGATRAVHVEADPHLPAGVRRMLTPASLTWCLGAACASTARSAALSPELLAEAAGDRELRGFLGWRSYQDAVLACENGQRAAARAAFDILERLVPQDERARALADSCRARSK